jgi:hypothetical protein
VVHQETPLAVDKDDADAPDTAQGQGHGQGAKE